jgi:hypothetical protein
MRANEIEVGKTYSKDPDRPGRRHALDRTVVAIGGAPTQVTYESDSIIGRKTISLAAFATWARRVL